MEELLRCVEHFELVAQVLDPSSPTVESRCRRGCQHGLEVDESPTVGSREPRSDGFGIRPMPYEELPSAGDGLEVVHRFKAGYRFENNHGCGVLLAELEQNAIRGIEVPSCLDEHIGITRRCEKAGRVPKGAVLDPIRRCADRSTCQAEEGSEPLDALARRMDRYVKIGGVDEESDEVIEARDLGLCERVHPLPIGVT